MPKKVVKKAPAVKKKKTAKKKVAKKKVTKKSLPKGPIIDVTPVSKKALVGGPDFQKLRMEGQLLYVTTLQQISVHSLHQDPRFITVPETTLQKWAHQDQWVDKRKAFFSKLGDELQGKLARSLSQTLLAEVQQLMQVREMALTQLTAKDEKTSELKLKPRSWEGVAKILLEVNSRLDDIRKTVSGEILDSGTGGAVPGLGNANPTPSGAIPAKTISYDEDELQDAAKHVLQKRRTKLREKMKEAKEKEAAEKKPALKMVKK